MAISVKADFTPALAALRRISPTPKMIQKAQKKEAAKTARATISEMSRVIKIGLSGKYTKARMEWSILPDGLEVFVHPKKTRISGAHFRVSATTKKPRPDVFRGKGGVRFSRNKVKIITGKYTPELPVIFRGKRPIPVLAPWGVDGRFIRQAEKVARKVLPKHITRIGARLERELRRKAGKK